MSIKALNVKLIFNLFKKGNKKYGKKRVKSNIKRT